MSNIRLSKLNLRLLITCVMKDVGLTNNDIAYIQKRFRSEGVKLLTVTLPKLSKQVVRGLETGYFERNSESCSLTCFAWRKRSLRNFRSLLDQIFDPESGYLLDNPSASAIQGIRQFSEYFYKLAFAFDPAELDAAELKYRKMEQELASCSFDRTWAESLRRNFETFYRDISTAEVHDVFGSSRPRDGSGSFEFPESRRGRIRANLDIPFWRYRKRPAEETGLAASEFLPYAGFFRPYPSAKRVSIALRRQEKSCAVLFVPKDSRGPRVISKEPYFYLKAQMSYFDWITPILERITGGAVQFTEQGRFRELAKTASIDRSKATLDLKDASDRVRYDLIKHIFSQSPACRWFVTNCRSLTARLPSGSVIELRKLAGMGSGLTFPTMALLIHLSICTRVATRTGQPYKSVMRSVNVYGDDVIVPNQWYDIAVEALRLSGLCVNADKSFSAGHFRESCGGDYYDGVNVAPIRLRLAGAGLKTPKDYSSGVVDVNEHGILQLERHCRELVGAHMYNTYEYLYKCIENTLGPLPPVSGESPFLGRYTQYPEEIVFDDPVKAWVPNIRRDFDARMCPYKHLGSFFKQLVADGTQTLFGVIGLPRKVSLKNKPAYGSALRGRLQAI